MEALLTVLRALLQRASGFVQQERDDLLALLLKIEQDLHPASARKVGKDS